MSSELVDAMRTIAERHARRLLELGEVRVLALDPCPRCGGNVVAGENEARCSAGCGWRFVKPHTEPIASRRADQ